MAQVATPGVVVLDRRRAAAWCARWRDLRVARRGAAALDFVGGRVAHDPFADGPRTTVVVRADCASAAAAAALRAALRAVGVPVLDDDDEADADEDEADADACFCDDGPLPDWLEAALLVATAPPERRNCLRQRCREVCADSAGDAAAVLPVEGERAEPLDLE